MNPLSVTKKINFETEQGTKAKAFKLKCDKKLLDDAQKRREESVGFAARMFAEMALKLRKSQEQKLENTIKFIELAEAGKILSSICAAIGEFKFFSMVSVYDEETGETMFAFGLCMNEDELLHHFTNDAMSMLCNQSLNRVAKKINNTERSENNFENSL